MKGRMTKETPTDRWTAIGTKRNNNKKHQMEFGIIFSLEQQTIFISLVKMIDTNLLICSLSQYSKIIINLLLCEPPFAGRMQRMNTL